MKILGPIVAVTVLISLILAAGCETTTTSGGTTRYNNSEYNFSFEISDRFEKGEEVTGTGSATDTDFSVVFLDPDGAKVGDTALDTFKVTVYELGQEITPDLMPDFKASLEDSVAQLLKSDPSMVAQPLTETTLNGLPGWKTDYSKTVEGTTVKARTYFLVKGQREFQITMWSSEANWPKNEPDLQKAADSFTLD